MLALAKGPSNRNIWVKLEFIKADNSVETTYYRKIKTTGSSNMNWAYQNTTCGWVRSSRNWSWLPGGPGEETIWQTSESGTRQATKLRISLVTPDTFSTPETWYANVFIYTASAGWLQCRR